MERLHRLSQLVDDITPVLNAHFRPHACHLLADYPLHDLPRPSVVLTSRQDSGARDSVGQPTHDFLFVGQRPRIPGARDAENDSIADPDVARIAERASEAGFVLEASRRQQRRGRTHVVRSHSVRSASDRRRAIEYPL